MALLDEVLEAHGGAARWAAARTVRAQVRSGGLLVRTRLPGNQFRDGRLEVEIGSPRAVLEPFPGEGRRAVFDRGSARIEAPSGEVLAERANPRPLFFGRSGLRRNLRWDPLDATYFAGYAWWNYLNTPHLLAREGVEAVEGEPWRQGGERWRRLEVRFPAEVPTHSAEQTFYYDQGLRLRRHDYVAEVIGGWAHGAHMCAGHVEAGGLLFPTRRWVRPIGLRNRPLPFPTLIALELSGIEVESGAT